MRKLFPLLLILAVSCKQLDFNADLLVKNAVVYTVDSTFSTADAFVVKGGKIIAVGKSDSLEKIYKSHETVDAGGKAVYPGFIDAHSHFYEYGLSLQEVALEGIKSWDEIVDTVNSLFGKQYRRLDHRTRLGSEHLEGKAIPPQRINLINYFPYDL